MNQTTDLDRAQGCLLGQLAGDSLGSLVEFRTPESIARAYPHGVSDLADGGTWSTLAGQPTDDSELALALARSINQQQAYSSKDALKHYRDWLDSRPFDCGNTIRSSLRGQRTDDSQANGALMRISPLAIFGSYARSDDLAKWAKQDAELTHPNQICQLVNVLFVQAIALAIKTGADKKAIYNQVLNTAEALNMPPALTDIIRMAESEKPADFVHQQGWVLIAFQNTLWQLLHAPDPETGIIDTVMQGGDTDTNAAICGALLGAVYGIHALPNRWVETILNCRPAANNPACKQPRPEHYWPIDSLVLAEQLLTLSRRQNEQTF